MLFRVDVPDLLKEGKAVRVGITRYFGLSAIYSITPVSEEIVNNCDPSRHSGRGAGAIIP